jgi:hypothetical protein
MNIEHNVDVSLSNEGGFSFDPQTITPEISSLAWRRAAAFTSDPKRRTIEAYRQMQILTDEISDKNKLPTEQVKAADMVKPETAATAPRTDKPTNVKRKKISIDTIVSKVIDALGEKIKLNTEPPRPAIVEQRPITEQKEGSKAEVFSVLGIPGLSPTPNKPSFRVQFDLGHLGKQEAWYHWVVEHEGCLFLIYDTRFEFGIRYSPPNLGAGTPMRVSLPAQNKSYTVYSMDLNHPFGVFHIVNLIIDRGTVDASKVDVPMYSPRDNASPGGPPTLDELNLFEGFEHDGKDWRD